MGRVSEHLFCEKKKEKKKRKNYIILATRIFNKKKIQLLMYNSSLGLVSYYSWAKINK